ncbi:MAG: hypothetical protein J7L75_05105, partial [Thermoproteales archaeon]|nr:hypothetical protein [Thermoproteales archaeon]
LGAATSPSPHACHPSTASLPGDGVVGVSGGGLVAAYRATLLFKLACEGSAEWREPAAVAGAVRELLDVEVSPGLVERWMRGDVRARPIFRNTPLEEALFYREAYEMAVALKRKNPGWDHHMIAWALSLRLPIYIPASTVEKWLRGSRPEITPLRVCPALGYRVGVLKGDYNKNGYLRAEDAEFARHYAMACSECSGFERLYTPVRGLDGYWYVHDSSAPLRELDRSGLWKVIARIYPAEFLKGLFDSDGSVSPSVECEGYTWVPEYMVWGVDVPEAETLEEALYYGLKLKHPIVKLGDEALIFKHKLKGVRISLTKSNWEVIALAARLLRTLGLEPVHLRVDGSCYKLEVRSWASAEKFAKLVGFRMSYRGERLSYLLQLKELDPYTRYARWYTRYWKTSWGRWMKRWVTSDAAAVAARWLRLLRILGIRPPSLPLSPGVIGVRQWAFHLPALATCPTYRIL